MKVLTRAEKKTRFDLYWQSRDVEKTDLRSQKRSEIAFDMLTKRTGKLLDVGCGRGWNALFFRQKGFEVEAIDISPEAVEVTRQKGISARIFDLEQDELPGACDVILCLEVFQFLVNPLKALRKLRGALQDEGELILSLPNEFHILRRLKILFGRPDFGGYNAPHLRLFYPAEIRRLMHDAGLRIISTRAVSIIPPHLRFLSKLGDVLSRSFPGLFSLSMVVRADREFHE
jgi:2-polyprenyl-3-methyl-5-hydroxy-6-metoxy-1,4-benzoquinol methylase